MLLITSPYVWCSVPIALIPICSVPFTTQVSQPLSLPFLTWNYKQMHLTHLNTLKTQSKIYGCCYN
jgi:hypothetical protein